jgi:signal transduction histidine kinase
MAARIAWSLALVSLVCAIADTIVTAEYRSLLSEEAIAVHGWPFAPAATVGAAVMGALIVSRYDRHRIGWLLCVIGVFSAASLLGETYNIWVLEHDGVGPSQVGHVAGWLSVIFGGQVALGLFAVVFLIAPDGHLLSRRWRYAAAVAVVGMSACTAALLTLSPVEFVIDDIRFDGHPVFGFLHSLGILMIAASMVAAVVSMIVRLRRAHGDERQQLRLIALAAGAIAAGLVWLITVEIFNGGEQNWLAAMPLFVAYDVLPVSIAVAVLRFRLYDIDVIINRAVVVAVATAFAAIGYVTLVVGVGAAVGSAGYAVWPSVAAMILVALAFQPLRRSVVRLADRVAYGARAAPYEALADFSRRLGGNLAPEALLPAVAEATASAVLARRVAVRLAVPGGTDRWAYWPAGAAPPPAGPEAATEIDVVDRGERLGGISVVMPPGRSLRSGDRALLADLADQAALAFRNNRLSAQLAGQIVRLNQQTAELAESRARIISARDEERDRLEQAIQIGVAPFVEQTPARLRQLAADLSDADVERDLSVVLTNSGRALESLRDITRGIMPRQLARLGLASAVSAHLGHVGRAGSLVVDESLADVRLEQTVESTAYFGVVEAVRKLDPPISVRLAASDGRLALTIEGSATDAAAWSALRDRLESLGGSACWTNGDGRAVLAMNVPTETDLPPADGQPLRSCG